MVMPGLPKVPAADNIDVDADGKDNRVILIMEFESNSYEETQKFAEEFSKTLKAGDVLCMYGVFGCRQNRIRAGTCKGSSVLTSLSQVRLLRL